jgi:hypothetical protein
MESIKIESLTIEKLKNMLFSGQILNAASIVALYRSLDFHERYLQDKKKIFNNL